MWNLERSDWVAIAGSLAAGLVYGLLHATRVNVVLHDPFQPEPGLAAFGAFWLGIIVGVIVVVLVALLGSWFQRPHLPLGWLSGVATAGLFTFGWIVACSLTVD